MFQRWTHAVRMLSGSTALALGALALGVTPASAAIDPCTTDGSGDITVTFETSGTMYLLVSPFDDEVLTYDFDLDDFDLCGETTATAETITITGADLTGNETLIIDETYGGALEPGGTDEGGAGVDDEIEVTADLDTGTDTLIYFGTDNADRLLTGAAGLDTSASDSDDDVTMAGFETMYVYGFGGDDTLSVASAPTGVVNVVMDGGFDDDALTGGSNGEIIDGSYGVDTINSSSGDDLVGGGPGSDTLNAGTGTDTYSPDTGYAYTDAELTEGLNLRLGQEANVNDGYGDPEFAIGFETITGTGFDDTIRGGSLGETMNGGLGADVLNGGAGDDTLNGGDGEDKLIGSYGADTLSGGNEDDRILPGSGNDTIAGGEGTDLLDLAKAGSKVTVNLTAGTSTSTTEGTDTVATMENITGTKYADSLTGNGSANVLTGGDAGDTLSGAAGDDTLTGGYGNDTLNGGSGTADVCSGGSGTGDSATGCETETGIP